MPLQSVDYPFSGINRDIPPAQLQGEWSDGMRVHFRRGFATAVKGDKEIEEFATAPQHLLNYWDGTNSYWLNFNASTVLVSDLTTVKTITPTVYGTPVTWTSGILNGVVFANNGGTDEAFIWGLDFATPTIMSPMADAPECAAMRAYRNVLVAMDCSASGHGTIPAQPTTVSWSRFNDPGSAPSAAGDWTPSSTNAAGFTELGTNGGRCLDGIQFRDSFLIGKNNGFWVMDLVGGNEIMGFRPLFISSGLMGQNMMAEVDGLVYALTDSDIIRTDGNQVVSVVDRINRKRIFDLLGDNWATSHVAYHRKQRELWVSVPVGQDDLPTRTHVLDIDTGKWGHRENGPIDCAANGRNNLVDATTWATVTGTWASIDRKWGESSGSVADILGWASGAKLYEADGETSSITRSLTRESLDMGSPHRRKNVLRVIPEIEADPGVVVTITAGWQNSADEAVTWPVAATATFTAGTDTKADLMVGGKFISFKFSSTSEFALPSFRVEYREAGLY